MSHRGDIEINDTAAVTPNPFELYEPRPEYRKAACVTENNLEAIAKYVGERRQHDTSPIALVDHCGGAIILQHLDGTRIGVARLGDYIIETVVPGAFTSTWSIEKRGDFKAAWRKRIGDD